MTDPEDFLEETIPRNKEYFHHLRNVDKNGSARLRNSLYGCSLCLPIQNSKIMIVIFRK